jgi:hypothetical protein
MLRRQRVGQDVLRVIRILVFVDADVLKPLLKLGKDIRVIAHRMGDAQQQIVEIQGVARHQQFLILRINARHLPLIEILRLGCKRFGGFSSFCALLMVA